MLTYAASDANDSFQASYDAEGRNTSVTSTVGGTTIINFSYDGDGKRVQKSVVGGATTTFVYDAQGNLAAEYLTGGTNPHYGTQYLTADHLGSTRMETMLSASGSCGSLYAASRSDYLPFGQEIPTSWNRSDYASTCTEPDPSQRIKFTSKERDAETGLDFFNARYFSSAQGRFTSPDPLDANLIRVLNPQRWNKYAYVVNNPLAFTDPDGKDAIAVNFSSAANGLGHAGVIAVDPNGNATYGDFQPQTPGSITDTGLYRIQNLTTKVAFGADGLPTRESLRKITSEVGDIDNAALSTISLAYYKTSAAESAALLNYLNQAQLRQNAGTQPRYFVGINDCIRFCTNGLAAAGLPFQSNFFQIPNFAQLAFAFLANTTFQGSDDQRQTPVITSKVCFTDENGNQVCQ